MKKINERFQDMLRKKHSAAEGYAMLQKDEMSQLLNICNGFSPLALFKKVSTTYSGDETVEVDYSVDPIVERDKIGYIEYFTQNTSKPLLLEQVREWSINNGSSADNVDSCNIDDIVSKISSMSAAEYYGLVYRIALFGQLQKISRSIYLNGLVVKVYLTGAVVQRHL